MPAAEGSDREAAGLLSSLSDRLATREETALLAELRRELATDLAAVPPFPELKSDCRLLRTLRGFDHGVPEAAQAFRQHLAMRERYGLDVVRERVAATWAGRLWELRLEEMPHGELLCSYMPEVLIFAVAKNGDPVSLGLWGRGRPADFVRQVPNWQELFLEYFLHVAEARSLLLEEASRTQGRLCHFNSVFDLQDWTLMGNYDRAWTKFCTEVTGPVGMTYHDINARLFAIRTTQMAKMAYNMVKPLLPKKVKDKVCLLGSDFQSSPPLRALLHETALASLEAPARQNHSRRGEAVLQPGGGFSVHLEVPPGGGLRWRFSLERGECFGKFGPCRVRFSVARHARPSRKPCFIEGFEPRLVEADGGTSGELRLPADGADMGCSLEVRWENSDAVILSQRLRYNVEVEYPVAVAKTAKASNWLYPLHPLLVLVLSVCLLGLSVVLKAA